MLLRRLLDPEETARRRKLRARIVRRNRIQREIAHGLEPKWRRIPKQKDRTVDDYGWDPLEDGTAVAAQANRVGKDGNALAFLVAASTPSASGGGNGGSDGVIHRPHAVAMQGVDHVAPRFANRTTDVAQKEFLAGAVGASGSVQSSRPGQAKATALAASVLKPVDKRIQKQWHDVQQLILIQRHEEILRKDPNRMWRQERLGLLLFARTKYKEASGHLTKAITLGCTKSICWRRLAQCHFYLYNETHDWDALWDAKTCYEQALEHLEMACNPYVLYEYARVLEALGSYANALNACASLLTTFPKFALATQVQVRFVLLQRFQFLTYGASMGADEKERALMKCIEMTKKLLLVKAEGGANPLQIVLVLYLHVRLNELLYETSAKRGDGPGTVARGAKTSADQATEELFKAAIGFKLTVQPTVPGMTWKVWRSQSETYMQWADYFQKENENIAASDALSRALELMETMTTTPVSKPPGISPGSPGPGSPDATLSVARKIQLYMAMAQNYYESNQMERAIRAMETIFQLNPYLETVRQSLAAWFPAKWKLRIELEDASQVQIARVLRGLWGRRVASQRRHEKEKFLEAAYRENPYHPRHRRQVVKLLRTKYAPVFAAQELACRQIQKSARMYLGYARIKWAFQEQREKEIQALLAKYATKKYRYNRHVRFQLAQAVREPYEARFRQEDQATLLMQRWYRGERVRRQYRATLAADKPRREREALAARRIQVAFRKYLERSKDLALVSAQQLFYETQRRLQLARVKLAYQLQGLYHQWKTRLVFLSHLELKKIRIIKQSARRHQGASCVQLAWRRYAAWKRGDDSGGEATLLLEQLKRGHDRVMAEDSARQPLNLDLVLDLDGAARKIQALYRGKRIRSSMAKITRQSVPVSLSEVELLVDQCEKDHASGKRLRVVLTQLESVTQKRALFDYPVVILRPVMAVQLPIQHIAAAVQHSAVLHTLILDGGHFKSPRIQTLIQALQASKSIKVLALGSIVTQSRPATSQRSPSFPEQIDDDDGGASASSSGKQLSPMQLLSTALCTKNFLLEQLLLDGNDLLYHRDEDKEEQDGALLANIIGDYFYGRYGKLTTLAAQRMALSDGNAVHLGDALSINTVLQHLNLSGNAIRDTAAMAIATKGLRMNHTLVYLNLAENGIGSGGGKALFSCLDSSNLLSK